MAQRDGIRVTRLGTDVYCTVIDRDASLRLTTPQARTLLLLLAEALDGTTAPKPETDSIRLARLLLEEFEHMTVGEVHERMRNTVVVLKRFIRG